MARDQDDIEQILQSCLELIQSGQETVDSVLGRYPELESTLRPQIEAAIWLNAFTKELDPRPGYIAASRSRLMARIQEETAQKAEQAREAKQIPFWQRWLRQGWFPQRSWVPVAVILILFVSLFSVTSGVVMAAQESLPGDSLYPIKLTLEKVALAVSLDAARDAQLALEFTQRRSVEFNELIVAGRYEDAAKSVPQFEAQVKQTIETLDDVADENGAEAQILASSLKEILSTQTRVFAKLIDNAPGTAKPAIDKAMKVSSNGADAAEDLIDEEPAVLVPSPTPTLLATRMPATATRKPTQPRAAQATPTSAPTETSIPTDAPTETPIPTKAPTSIPIPTKTPVPPPSQAPTETPSPTSTATATNTPTPTPTHTPMPTYTNTPTSTPTSTPTETPTETATNVPEPSITETPGPNGTVYPVISSTTDVVFTESPGLSGSVTPMPFLESPQPKR